MTTLQKSLITAVIVAAMGAGIYQAREASKFREQVESLKQQQQSAPTDQLQQLTSERDTALHQLADLREENERLNRNSAELIRLRGEVGRLRQSERELAQLKASEMDDPAQAKLKSWLRRVSQLKQRLEDQPEQKIPEMEFLKDEDWLNVTTRDLVTEKDFRRAMSSIRDAAESRFVPLMQSALKKYMDANKGSFPTEMMQLQPFFKMPVTEEILSRYEILPAERLVSIKVGGDWVITQKSVIDESYDSRIAMGPNGSGSTSGAGVWKNDNPLIEAYRSLAFARKAYKADHKGNDPAELSRLNSYLNTTQQREALEMLIKADKEMKARFQDESE